MKRYSAIALFVIVVGGYVAYQYFGTRAASTVAAAPAQPIADTAASGGSSSTQPVPTQSADAEPARKSGGYADGSYTGDAVNAYFGMVQVKVTIAGGKITDVAFVQYPNDRPESRTISTNSLATLKSEVIASQSANVNGVSGATQTSAAFNQSLSSALAKAAA